MKISYLLILGLVAWLSLTACAAPNVSRLEGSLPNVVSSAYMLFYGENEDEANDSSSVLLEVAAVLYLTDATAILNGFRGSHEPENIDQLRLDGVVSFLTKQGVELGKLQVLPRGVAPPLAPEDDGSGARRIEIIIVP